MLYLFYLEEVVQKLKYVKDWVGIIFLQKWMKNIIV